MKIKSVATRVYEVFIAGDYTLALDVCRKFCMKVGLCVTVEPTEYVYTAGQESGVRIGLRAYPRFPKTPINLHAVGLAKELMKELCQETALVVTPEQTTWFSNRKEDE